MRQWSFWKLSKTLHSNFSKSVELLKTFQNTIWKLSKTRGACIAIHAQKTKPGALLVGRRPLLANGGIPRCELAEHVLPIIRWLWVCTTSLVASKSRRQVYYQNIVLHGLRPPRTVWADFEINWASMLFRTRRFMQVRCNGDAHGTSFIISCD
jgi:hypothetical protein